MGQVRSATRLWNSYQRELRANSKEPVSVAVRYWPTRNSFQVYSTRPWNRTQWLFSLKEVADALSGYAERYDGSRIEVHLEQMPSVPVDSVRELRSMLPEDRYVFV